MDVEPGDFDITTTEVTTGEGEEAVTVTRLTATLNQERYNQRRAQEVGE